MIKIILFALLSLTYIFYKRYMNSYKKCNKQLNNKKQSGKIICPKQKECAKFASCPKTKECAKCTSCPKQKECAKCASCPKQKECAKCASCPKQKECPKCNQNDTYSIGDNLSSHSHKIIAALI